MAKELVMDLVNKSMTRSLVDWCMKVVVEDVLTELVVGSGVSGVIQRLELVEGMEYRLIKELNQREDLRQKQARIARRMVLESKWLAKRR